MAIPIINIVPGLTQWRQVLNKSVKSVPSPKVPWNFQVANKQGGNYLTWQTVSGADGYIVEISTNGDFSTGVDAKQLPGNNNISYFDTVPTSSGASPAIRYYRVRATAGTTNQPQSVQGNASGAISSTAIAPNDSTTASTTTTDTTTTDGIQANTRKGVYRGTGTSAVGK
jgi:hypothetical protein